MLDLLNGSQGEVRAAAIRLGSLGSQDDVPRLVAFLSEAKYEKDAVNALTRLPGGGVNAALCIAMKTAAPALAVKLIRLLVARHAVEIVPTLTEAPPRTVTPRCGPPPWKPWGNRRVRTDSQAGPPILDAKDAPSREERRNHWRLSPGGIRRTPIRPCRY